MIYPDSYKIQSWSLKFQMLKNKEYFQNQEWYLKLREEYPKEPIKVIDTKEELIECINFLKSELSPTIEFRGYIFIGEISLHDTLLLLEKEKIYNIRFAFCYIENCGDFLSMRGNYSLSFQNIHLNNELYICHAKMFNLKIVSVKVTSIFMFNSTFEMGIHFENISASFINCISVHSKSNFTLSRMTSLKTLIFDSIEVQYINIHHSNFFKLELTNVVIADTFMSNNLELGTFNAQAVIIQKGYFYVNNFVVHDLNRETCQFIVTEAKRRNNNILAMDYKVREMDLYRKEVKHWKTAGTFLLLTLNKWSNNYGKSWVRGLAFIGISWILFFSLFVIFRDGWGNSFIWSDPIYMKEAVNYLWLLDGLNEISNCETMNWCMIAAFILGKVAIAYGIYQAVSAFRRFGK